MRIVRLTPEADCPPYNNLFAPVADVLDHIVRSVLRSRTPTDDDPAIDPVETFVNIPDIERQIKGFALNRESGVALLIGPKGIGKTSVLRYLREAVWKGQLCRVIPCDLSSQTYADRLGGDYYLKSHGEQHAIANTTALSIIEELLLKVVTERDETYRNGFMVDVVHSDYTKFIAFVRTYFMHALGDLVYKSKPAENDFRKAIDKMPAGNRINLVFSYYLHSCNIHHVKLLIDNTDDKDGLLICRIVEQLAHLQAQISDFSSRERRINPLAPYRHASPIVSCRPATASLITTYKETRGGGWHPLPEINIVEPPDLSDVIERRFQFVLNKLDESGGLQRSVQVSMGDLSYPIDDVLAFYRNVFEVYRLSGRSREVMGLSNLNVADALYYTLQILRNRKFLDDSAVFAKAQEKTTNPWEFFLSKASRPSDFRRLFPSSTAIKCLAYGNQATEDAPQYPVIGTPVVNILDSEYAPIARTAFKPRVLSMLASLAEKRGRLSTEVPYLHLLEYEKWFDISKDQLVRVIDEMYEEGLLGNNRSAEKPSQVGVHCDLFLTRRAYDLWDHLQTDSVLVECYRDQIDLLEGLPAWNGKPVSWSQQRTTALSINARAEESFWVVYQIWLIEKSELEAVALRGDFLEFNRCFGAECISRRLLRGLEISDTRFYQKHEGKFSYPLLKNIHLLRDIIDEWYFEKYRMP